MARMAFQMYDKQKNYQEKYNLLLAKCDKLEEDLAQAQRDMNIWIEHSRGQDIKVIGPQRTVSSNHARLSALEQSVAALRENATKTDDRVDRRFRRINEHTALVDDILGTHTSSIQRLGKESRQQEEAVVYSSIGRDQELSNRLAGCEGRAHILSEL
eukprot:437562-Amphidinium_carterae.1